MSDLETRLSTDRVLDVFTMKPKVFSFVYHHCLMTNAFQPQPVRLQMTPPSLTYTREIRSSTDVVISVTPRATGVEVVHRHGHVFVLSDLFLVCERMTPAERSAAGPDGADMFLCYPPLAGKVLRVAETPGKGSNSCQPQHPITLICYKPDDELQVTIMRKEVLNLRVNSKAARDALIADFRDCIAFASGRELLTSLKVVGLF